MEPETKILNLKEEIRGLKQYIRFIEKRCSDAVACIGKQERRMAEQHKQIGILLDYITTLEGGSDGGTPAGPGTDDESDSGIVQSSPRDSVTTSEG